MKIYIVTRGVYSDYRIEQVFLSEDKANEYCKYSKGYGEAEVDEFDTFDNSFNMCDYKTKKYIQVCYECCEKDGIDRILFEIREYGSFNQSDIDKYPFNDKSYSYSANTHYIHIRKVVDDDFIITEEVETKYLKICRDYMAKVKSLRELEGMKKNEIARVLFN